jgi:uncharacterized protein HemX
MRTLLRVAVLIGLVLVLVWLVRSGHLGLGLQHAGQDARREIGTAARDAKKAWKELDLEPEKIEEELRQTGRVVRKKTAQLAEVARKVAEATEDARTTAAIETEYALDPDLSALQIDVNTTDGRVTLAGRVDSAADLARAIEIAFRHDNVQEVVSTLRIRRPAREPASVVR